MAFATIQIPENSGPVFDESEQFPILIGGNVTSTEVQDIARKSGRDVVSPRKIGENPVHLLVDVSPVPEQNSAPDTNH